jgi:hypothetical protein
MSALGKYADSVYLEANPFGGDRDVNIRCQSERIVTTRKRQFCNLCSKTKRAGTRMFYEHAMVDGQWESNYACLPCLEKMCVDELVKDGCIKGVPRTPTGTAPGGTK